MNEAINKPRVTAIVSAWYAEEFLKARIENLLNQTVPVQVVIVCRTGSVEDKIAEVYRPAGVVILRVDQDITIYDAWNQAIKGTEGPDATEFIANANCDDRLYENAFEKMIKAFDDHKGRAVVYSDWQIAEPQGADEAGNMKVGIVGLYQWREGGLKELLEGCFLGPGPMWRRSLHAEIGYFDPELRSAGDYEFWLRVAAAGKRLYHIREVLGVYLSRENSAEHRQVFRAAWEAARARAKYAED